MPSNEQGWNHKTQELWGQKWPMVAWILTNLDVAKDRGAESNFLSEAKD